MALALLFLLPMFMAHRPVGFQPRSSVLRRMPMFYGKRDASMSPLPTSLPTAQTPLMVSSGSDLQRYGFLTSEFRRDRLAPLRSEEDEVQSDAEYFLLAAAPRTRFTAENRIKALTESPAPVFPTAGSVSRSEGGDWKAIPASALSRIQPVLYHKLSDYIQIHRDSLGGGVRATTAKPFGKKPNRFRFVIGLDATRDSYDDHSISPLPSKRHGITIVLSDLDRPERTRSNRFLVDSAQDEDDSGELKSRLEILARGLSDPEFENTNDVSPTSISGVPSSDLKSTRIPVFLLQNGGPHNSRASRDSVRDVLGSSADYSDAISDDVYEQMFAKSRGLRPSTDDNEDW